MYKLRSSVSVVDLGNNVIEFFKTNTRTIIKLKTRNETIKNIVLAMNGETPIEEIAQKYEFDSNSANAKELISYLKRKSILANDALVKQTEDYSKYRRVIHFLEDTGMTNTELYRETQQLYLLCQE